MSNTNRDMEDYRSTLERYYEKGLNDGRNETWVLMNKIEKLSINEIHDLFGEWGISDIVRKHTLQETFEKVEAYEKEQSTFKVGEVIESINTGRIGVITKAEENGKYVIFADGTSGMFAHDDIRKTGRYIDITSVLEQLRGNEYGRE